MQDLDATANDEQVSHGEVVISVQTLRDAMSRVYLDDSSAAAKCDFDTCISDLGMESLQLAGLIVELEEILGQQLEMAEVEQLATFGDLCSALRSIGELG